MEYGVRKASATSPRIARAAAASNDVVRVTQRLYSRCELAATKCAWDELARALTAMLRVPRAARLTQFPDQALFPNKLAVLDLRYNKITHFPDRLVLLTNLQHLDLTRNRIAEVPQDICLWQNLRGLFLGSNCLSAVPDTLGLLTGLKILRLDHNALVELPWQFGGMTSLNVLGLEYNKLTSLPPEIAQIEGLHLLSLAGPLEKSHRCFVVGLLSHLQTIKRRVTQHPHDARTPHAWCLHVPFVSLRTVLRRQSDDPSFREPHAQRCAIGGHRAKEQQLPARRERSRSVLCRG